MRVTITEALRLAAARRPTPTSTSRRSNETRWWPKTLDAFKVPAAEQNELVGIVGGTKPDIVVAGK
jgi:hypothetical protein